MKYWKIVPSQLKSLILEYDHENCENPFFNNNFSSNSNCFSKYFNLDSHSHDAMLAEIVWWHDSWISWTNFPLFSKPAKFEKIEVKLNIEIESPGWSDALDPVHVSIFQCQWRMFGTNFPIFGEFTKFEKIEVLYIFKNWHTILKLSFL